MVATKGAPFPHESDHHFSAVSPSASDLKQALVGSVEKVARDQHCVLGPLGFSWRCAVL